MNKPETKQKRCEYIPKYEAAMEKYLKIFVGEVNYILNQHRTKEDHLKVKKKILWLDKNVFIT